MVCFYTGVTEPCTCPIGQSQKANEVNSCKITASMFWPVKTILRDSNYEMLTGSTTIYINKYNWVNQNM
jgi:hypothetical protein